MAGLTREFIGSTCARININRSVIPALEPESYSTFQIWDRGSMPAMTGRLLSQPHYYGLILQNKLGEILLGFQPEFFP
jgi:hypothetical protein